ncbi:MAG: hypothetical protein ACREME_06325, partial [Gemmatimonadales bacterium]
MAEAIAAAADARAVLAAFARLAVPHLADICVADVARDDGMLERLDGTLAAWEAPRDLTAPLPAGEAVVVPALTPAAA